MAHALPLLLRVYRALATPLAPLAHRLTKTKLTAQGIDLKRLGERQGVATQARPKGALMWFHAASVGESLSSLRLIEHLAAADPARHFLITSGTATSAQILAKRLPPRCTHQFAPLDSPIYVRRFLNHWQPDEAVFIESELWPNMILETDARGVPLALLNARISDKTAASWSRVPRTARALLSSFRLIHCQDTRTARHLQALGAIHAAAGTNLKSLAGPLPFSAATLAQIKNSLGARPLWLASSTHQGEEATVLAAHKALLATHPDVLLILVPRHPERAEEIKPLIRAEGLMLAQRSSQEPIHTETQVYLADTLGETGLWYALSPLTFLGGSLVPVGGHNPYEPAHTASALLHGPLYANFAQGYAALQKDGASLEVTTAIDLADSLHSLLDSPEALQRQRALARAFAQAQNNAVEDIATTLCHALSQGKTQDTQSENTQP
ncbi:3-deoxy-D-manno-octulosonic acid transferase [Lentibacter sp.]|uniref:3-deoxy-D-manno-octulosonic acid transferase n=1 Tax=Lentibacter sp. TaxID=2024994 RepID=UPI003F6A27C4